MAGHARDVASDLSVALPVGVNLRTTMAADRVGGVKPSLQASQFAYADTNASTRCRAAFAETDVTLA